MKKPKLITFWRKQNSFWRLIFIVLVVLFKNIILSLKTHHDVSNMFL